MYGDVQEITTSPHGGISMLLSSGTILVYADVWPTRATCTRLWVCRAAWTKAACEVFEHSNSLLASTITSHMQDLSDGGGSLAPVPHVTQDEYARQTVEVQA